MEQKRFIFFPSLSSGNSKLWLSNNNQMNSGVTSRFYSDDYPAEYRHKYFLVSAGHNVNNDTCRADLGLGKDCFVMGDSGGYQIMTGAMKWKPETKDKILNWLENNSDIAINLDIPPRGKKFGYDESIQLSYDNFKYFTEHRQGKTEFLNVLQGANQGEMKFWFNKMKDFKFDGWSIGGMGGNIYGIMYAFALFLDTKELEKQHNKYVHILGASSVMDFWFFAVLQKFLNQRFDNRIYLTTDSSSSNRATVFGSWFYDVNWKNMNQITNYFGNKGNTAYNLDMPLACRLNCPACQNTTYADIEPYNEQTYVQMTNHNLAFQINVINTVNKLIDSHDEMIKEVCGREYLTLYNCIKDVILSDNPIQEFFKYEQVFLKYGNMTKTQTNDTVVNEFFNFK